MKVPSSASFEPRRPVLVAGIVYVLAAASLCWPMFQGKFLGGPNSDMFIAGYAFRAFGASFLREYGSIPLWNPYLMGGVPYVAGTAGDVFYPTALLRALLPVDVAINLGFALHLVLAGWGMFALLRLLRMDWTSAVVGGLAYQLSGIVFSMVHPGHDGKLFVSALAPVLLLAIVMAVRDRRIGGYALLALTTGLSYQAHPQPAMYLSIAAAIWGVFWLFADAGPPRGDRLRVAAAAVGSVGLGLGLYAIYAVPMVAYVPFGPRAAGGPSTGWQHAISYSLPPGELLGTILPKIDGGPGNGPYFGQNGLKLHTEYLGVVTLVLAWLGWSREWTTDRRALTAVGLIFLLVSLGGHTPFFRLWYALVPMSSRLRAPGMAFFLVALAVAFLAARGAAALTRGEVTIKRFAVPLAICLALGAVAAIGGLQFVSEDIARGSNYQGAVETAIANAQALRADGVRVVVTSLLAGLVLAAASARRLPAWAMPIALGSAVLADAWPVARRYFVFSPPARVTYSDDEVTTMIKRAPVPYRIYAPVAGVQQLNPYPPSGLMAVSVPQLLGYHGNELTAFDDLLGGKSVWPNQLHPNLWRLFAIRFIVLNQRQEVPGYHVALGPVETAHGPVVLLEADSIPPYARVVTGAAKIPESQLVATVTDPRFPIDRLALYPDTASVNPAALNNQIPNPSSLTATVGEWRPGRMKITITGTATVPEYLVVAENWYPDWHATIDGKPAHLLRAQNTLLSVELPPGAKEVTLQFASAAYAKGRLISLVSLAGVLALFAVPLVQRTKRADG